ncbi:hypothetical protein [Methylorubrum extorquens]|uniref:Uncharacterized protein n=1 Tax=Methylorubrum extorquens TaxID=408 RepID=A0AAX3WFS0_METEX|nr:hypothetical protein [Methylorubrum extorquens]WHQ69460.1 hypothetical protein KEC54_24485 [Methylorubrum extorquens]
MAWITLTNGDGRKILNMANALKIDPYVDGSLITFAVLAPYGTGRMELHCEIVDEKPEQILRLLNDRGRQPTDGAS